MDDIDVTKLVEFGNNDDECLPITKCICCKKYPPWDNFIISIYKNDSTKCESCGRKFYFRNTIKVYMTEEDKGEKMLVKTQIVWIIISLCFCLVGFFLGKI